MTVRQLKETFGGNDEARVYVHVKDENNFQNHYAIIGVNCVSLDEDDKITQIYLRCEAPIRSSEDYI